MDIVPAPWVVHHSAHIPGIICFTSSVASLSFRLETTLLIFRGQHRCEAKQEDLLRNEYAPFLKAMGTNPPPFLRALFACKRARDLYSFAEKRRGTTNVACIIGGVGIFL
jgi:hypothetical protein